MGIQTFEEREVYAGFKYEGLLQTSVLDFATTIAPNHISFGSLSGGSYSGNDLPNDSYKTGTFYVNSRTNTSKVVFIVPDDTTYTPVYNVYTSSGWSGWKSLGSGGGGSIVVDSQLSTTSTNPVQNKVITSALNNKANISDIPTELSELTNDVGYITSVSNTDVINALGYTPYNSSNPDGYITGINSNDVTTALGYTPYNSTNPNGYTSNTGTVTSIGLQNGGGLAISGSPVTISGTITVGHSNSITAQNTQGVYPVTIDANGHIASYGAKEDLLKVFTFESANGTPVPNFNKVLVYSDAADIANLTEINSIFDTKKVAIQFISTITGFEHTVMAFGTGERFNIDATDAGMGVLSNNMMFSFSGDYGDETNILGYIWADASRLYSGTLIVIPSLNAIMVRETRIDTNSYLSKNSVLTSEDYGSGTSKPIQVTPDTDISQIRISHTALNSSGEKDTQAVYPITVDVGGHITSVGNAVTIPTAGTTATAVTSGSSSGGSSANYSRADHVHNITSSTITGALGYTPYNATNPAGYITGISGADVTNALGYTPYNSTNPAGYITSSALNGYATETYVQNYHDSTKQNVLTAGTGIDITNNVISSWDISVGTGNKSETLIITAPAGS